MMRTHTCGELRMEHVGQTVTLCGWVQGIRDLGHFIFIDMRDRYGITQINVQNSDVESYNVSKKLGREFVICVTGKVAERESKNDNISTGSIEIIPEKVEILNESEVPPFKVEDDTDGLEDLRLKYRYLDIRRPLMTERLLVRAKMMTAVRSYLDGHGFCEIETPVLIKSTPEGARDFLVPSRLQKGNFYALPQSPQILKQLLMVSGMDRYYQVVKCFRDEDFRGDRQPEFTQIDCEMSFVGQEDILTMFEGMTKHVFKEVKGIEIPEFTRIRYEDAIKLYGSDKPDLRFDARIVELNDNFSGTEFKVFANVIASGGLVAGIKAEGCAKYSRKQIDQLTDFVRVPHRGAGGLVWIKFEEDGNIKSAVDKFFSKEELQKIGEKMDAKPGDMVLIISDKISKTRKVLGDLRLEIADREGWKDPNKWSILWVVDFPLFEKNEETNELTFSHHPFVMPDEAYMQYLDTEPEKAYALCYDLVMNGSEIVSGSVRIHRPDIQKKIFNILGLSEQEQQDKFGFLLEAFKYGAPPHAGLAFGFDRWVMLMTGGETIRDAIAFPKNSAGRDVMMDAPAGVPDNALEELGIKLDQEKEAAK